METKIYLCSRQTDFEILIRLVDLLQDAFEFGYFIHVEYPDACGLDFISFSLSFHIKRKIDLQVALQATYQAQNLYYYRSMQNAILYGPDSLTLAGSFGNRILH